MNNVTAQIINRDQRVRDQVVNHIYKNVISQTQRQVGNQVWIRYQVSDRVLDQLNNKYFGKQINV